MGACMCDSKSTRSQRRSSTNEQTRKNDNNYNQTTLSYTQNDTRASKGRESHQRKKELQKWEADNKENSLDILFVTLDGLMQSNQKFYQEWRNSNLDAMTVKLSNRSNESLSGLGNQKDIESCIVRRASEKQKIDGVVSFNKLYTKLSLAIDQIDIEFVLPQSRAGPIVVPYINYAAYQR